MGMPRRADMKDRGRRWIPKNGKFGAITITSVGATTAVSVGISGLLPSEVLWKTVDADTGAIDTVLNGATKTWNSANGGTHSIKLPGVITALAGRLQGLTSITIKGAKDWSNLSILDLDSNSLTSITTAPWPTLCMVDLHSNTPLAAFQTYEWPLLESLELYSTGISSLDTFDWPNLVTLNLQATPNLDTIEFRSWTSLNLLNFQYSGFTTAPDMSSCNLPNLTTLYGGYSPLTGNWNTSNTWTSLTDVSIPNYSGGALVNHTTFFETHPEWTSLKNFGFTFGDLTTWETHPEWVNIEQINMDKHFSLGDWEIHPEWTKLQRWLTKSNNHTAAGLDAMLIATDATGASGGIDLIDYQLAQNRADSSRSASANTAMANLVGKGWTILR